MDTDTYQGCLIRAYLMVRLIGDLPLGEMIDAAERADTLGPILDPTAWMKGHRKLAEDSEVLRALRPAWKLAKAHEGRREG